MASLTTTLEHLPIVPMAGLFFGVMMVIVWFFSTEHPGARKILGLLGVAGLLSLTGWLLALTVLRPQPEIAEVGGVTFILAVQGRLGDDDQSIPVGPADVAKARQTLEKRLDLSGVRDFKVLEKGGDILEVVLPGLDPSRIKDIQGILTRSAVLTLREVSNRNDEVGTDGKPLARRVMDGSELVPGYKVYQQVYTDETGAETKVPILLNRRAAITGGDIDLAIPSAVQKDAVEITLTSKGEDKMIALTRNMTPGLSRIAIMLDDVVVSAPTVNQTPLGKHFIVEGLNEPGEAQTLANSLMCPLESPLAMKEARPVSPKPNLK